MEGTPESNIILPGLALYAISIFVLIGFGVGFLIERFLMFVKSKMKNKS